ncbi:hypothetical protein AOLI_G00024740 [Acnodon oligacanthus]
MFRGLLWLLSLVASRRALLLGMDSVLYERSDEVFGFGADSVCVEAAWLDSGQVIKLSKRMKAMTDVQIRRYKDDDEVDVKDIFSLGMHELIPYTCKYVLKQPHVQVLLLSVFCVLLAISGSLLLPILAVTLLLAAGRQGICYMLYRYVQNSLRSDFCNIHQSYLEKPNSCFWVAESHGK